jgi:hypothetical protein
VVIKLFLEMLNKKIIHMLKFEEITRERKFQKLMETLGQYAIAKHVSSN